ncbi:choice-of-anchor A family protein [Bifidobacterium sp. SO4]|uniref:choice-of-anchor A family protein n=1 Tax=Bifidobacterium sp. SO4 TaxID=2809030 RepID=UPI001BDD186A|nr:choice-of-anchor A family protein [Bifidobacterium sp. SO4]MBT1170804.1 choice-of-anchor A family protein [Bifidobacterium sp. SO4]
MMNVPTMTPFAKGVSKAKALAAAALAATMLVGSAAFITAPRSVYAEGAQLSDGALCTPSEQKMGTDTDPSSTRDSGVATWVGGNMYVGKKPANTANLKNANGPDGSYAVEAEGLTVVNGKLMMNPIKNSWSGAGFRFGIAGFGTQFRPAKDSTALVVGGNTSDAALPEWSNVQAWSHSGFLRDNGHIASIAGASSDLWGATGTPSIGKNPANTNAMVNWNVTDPMENVTVKSDDTDTDASDDVKNLSESKYYQDYVIEDISAPLAFQTATGTVTQDVSTLSTLTRHKYNHSTSNVQYVFKYTDDTKTGTGRGLETTDSYTNREKLITFTGTNNPTMEVFDLDASMLTDYIDGTRYRGVAFAFENIADTASVVVNVTGDNKNIAFHNGWQFWWNGQEISDGYSDAASTGKAAAYAKAAQKILWNFHDTNNLTIYGGIANEGDDKYTEDDPAAAMLGSIIVIGNAESGDASGDADNTTGNFESHVTTNGRVYTEGDFSMHNPHFAAKFTQAGANDGDSASVIDMDQERHNFPWNGQTTTECAAIAWQKSDESGNGLAGTTWAIYGTYDDAANGENALYAALKDDDFADKDTATKGGFKVEGLKPNATYYIKEVATGDDSQYQLNTNIYTATTGEANTTAGVTQSVTMGADGTLAFGKADMTDDGKIVNKAAGHEVAWKKIADGDAKGTPLAGSAWQISKQDDTTGTQVWNVADNVNAATSVSIVASAYTLDTSNQYKATLTANVAPAEAVQNVTWTFTDASGNPIANETDAVLSQTSDLRADLIGTATADTTVYVKACSVSNPDVCSQPATITVKAANVTNFAITSADGQPVKDGDAITADALNADLTFKASSTPSVPVTWTTSSESIATLSTSGNGANATVHMVGFGTATITAKAGNRTISFTVKLPSTTVYFKKTLVGWSNYYLYYDDGVYWKFVKMDRTCGDYVAVTIPRVTSGKQFLFHDSTDPKSGNWYKPSTAANANFTFTGNEVQVVELYKTHRVRLHHLDVLRCPIIRMPMMRTLLVMKVKLLLMRTSIPLMAMV